MPTLDLVMHQEDFAALAMAAHIENMTLNAYVVSCLRAAADHEIERLNEEPSSVPENGSDIGDPNVPKGARWDPAEHGPYDGR